MAFSVVMPALEMAQETAPADGVLAGITGVVGSDIPVGQTIAWIVAPGEEAPREKESATAAPRARAGSAAKHDAREAPAAVGHAQGDAEQKVKISPKARRLAKELGVDAGAVCGSGAGGEVLASDVEAAAEAAKSGGKSNGLEIPSTLGRLMAERTAESWKSVPHFFVTRECEAGALNQYRQKIVGEIERTHQVRVSHTDLLVAIAARVLVKHPRLNSSWTAEGIRLHEHVNMGVAIAVNDGVVAAVIPNADGAGVAEIAVQRRDIAERARAGKLRPGDVADGTFTISNLGMYKVDQFSAIIVAPQAAILAVGGIADRIVAVEGRPAVRAMMTLTLSCDHRVVDGARGALFLNELVEALGEPGKWIA